MDERRGKRREKGRNKEERVRKMTLIFLEGEGPQQGHSGRMETNGEEYLLCHSMHAKITLARSGGKAGDLTRI